MTDAGHEQRSRRLSIAFLRPRMGIGGSERLVADAAVALTERGHEVTLVVPGPDAVQFPELAAHAIAFDAPRALLPNHIAGRLQAPLAIGRTAQAAWRMRGRPRRPDVIFSDVVPHVIPLAKRLTGAPVLYFCHYPDLLLTPDSGRGATTYRAYRRPLDRLEARGMAAADALAVNSRFTLGAARRTFPCIPAERFTVLNPGVAVPPLPPGPPHGGTNTILSISRFDPRKNLLLAVDTLAALRDRLGAEAFGTVRLVVAGRYDERRPDAVAVLRALRQRAREHGIEGHVEFVLSPTESERKALVAQCLAVLYTPSAEHFGYVPIEAMAAARPVVAADNGGPSETIVDGETGLLCQATADAFAAALARLVNDRAMAGRMGLAGHAHVARHFSLQRFGDDLDRLVCGMASPAAPAEGRFA